MIEYVAFAGWGLAAIGLAAIVGCSRALRRQKRQVEQLAGEAQRAGNQFDSALQKTEAMQQRTLDLEALILTETARRAAAEELSKRVPTLENELSDQRQRCGQLALGEGELRERLAAATAELSATQDRLTTSVSTLTRLTAERAIQETQAMDLRQIASDLRERIGRLESDLNAAIEQKRRAEQEFQKASVDRDEHGERELTLRQSVADLRERTGRLESELAAAADFQSRTASDLRQAVTDRDCFRSDLEASRRTLGERTIEFESTQASAQDKIAFLSTAREELSNAFKALAGEILETQSRQFSNSSSENLTALLSPLRERIAEFDKTVTGVYEKESRERITLQEQIRVLSDLHARMSQETENLTRALKGSGKTQGTWGELVLDRLLSGSGLREGEDYIAQQRLQDEEGNRLQPDIVINLPEEKCLVVDSKVALTAYERYVRSQEEIEQSTHLSDHLESVRRHVRTLSGKNYQALYGIRSPDFVLMFIPVESAFMLAMKEDSTLFDSALKQNVLIVCPSTLMATLRLVASIWRYEHQNQNAQEIARVVGQLFDKFVSFVGDLQEVGKKLSAATDAHEQALAKLSTGRGNLIRTAERVRRMGVKPSKTLPAPMVELADPEEEGDPEDPMPDVQLAD